MYYNTNAIDGRQALFRAIIGARGIGKTFYLKMKALKAPGACMWVRRYSNELDKCKESFTRDLVVKEKIDPESVRLVGPILQIRDGDDWVNKVYFQALSTANKIKSSSFPDVERIVYDEFIIVRGRANYLNDEEQKLFDLFSTVFRDRDGVCYLLANNISFINPIFLSSYFNVTDFQGTIKDFGPLDDQGHFIKDPDNKPYVTVEKWENPDFLDHMKATRWGRFVMHGEYGEFAIENKSLMDTKDLIVPYPKGAKRRCTIRIGTVNIGVYRGQHHQESVYYFDESYDPAQRTYAPRQALRANERPLLSSDYPLNWMKSWPGLMLFSNTKIKGIVQDIVSCQYFR